MKSWKSLENTMISIPKTPYLILIEGVYCVQHIYLVVKLMIGESTYYLKSFPVPRLSLACRLLVLFLQLFFNKIK